MRWVSGWTDEESGEGFSLSSRASAIESKHRNIWRYLPFWSTVELRSILPSPVSGDSCLAPPEDYEN